MVTPNLIVDPAHQQINPNIVDDNLFKSNSHNYRSGAPSGGSSTCDVVSELEPRETDRIKPVLSHDSPSHRAHHGVVAGTTLINNILGNEANDLQENVPEKWKPGSQNPTDPDHHDPFTKENLVRKVKV